MGTEPATNEREGLVLDEMHDEALRLIMGGSAAVVIGGLLLAAHAFGHAGVVLGFVGVLGGPLFAGIGIAFLRLLPAARAALEQPPRDVRLEMKVLKGGYGFRRFTMARLWSADADGRELAKFSESVHWQKPKVFSVDRAPARIFGSPVRGAAVVVSCHEGVVVGRIRRSHVQKIG